MKSSLFIAASALAASFIVAADDYLVSERYALHKRQESATTNITFLHINDVHAHLDEYRSNGVDCPRNTTENMNVTKVPCFGGYARVLERANEIRQEQPNTLFLNAGDEFQGTLFYSYYGGEVIAEVLNQGNFDAFTLGNHEFDGGDDMLAAFLANLTFPTVSSNVQSDNEALASQLNPYLIFPEHETAIVALTTNTTPDISSPGNGTTFGAYLDVQTTVDALLDGTAEGATNGTVKRVVALTHIGYEDDILFAQQTRNIHLIIGGHSHTRLGANETGAIGEYPTVVRNLDDEEVFVVTAWRWGQQLGRMDISWEAGSNRILAYTGAPINMTEDLPQNQTLQDQILEFREPFDAFSREVVGQTATDLDQTTCQQGECTLGNAVCDSMLYARTSIGANVDFAIHNAGGIRASIDAPEITRGEILTAFPFGNQLVDMSFTGRELWQIFEGIVSDVNANGREVTSFVQVSQNFGFTYNPNNPVGTRLISMNVTNADVDFERTYNIVTLDFIATGGDSFFPNPAAVTPPTLGSQSDVFEAWVVANNPVNVQLQNRIIITEETVPQHTL